MKRRGSEWQQIGSVGVDSGQLILTDPCYLGNWRDNAPVNRTAYKDPAGNLWAYGGHGVPEGAKPFVGDYGTKQPLFGGKTPNELIAQGAWERVRVGEQDDSYSYKGACDRVGPAKTLHSGGPGLAVVFSSGHGDGCYPVLAKMKGGAVQEIKIKFF